MIYILCIETSTEVCSVAIFANGQLVSHRESDQPYIHSSMLAVFIDECIKELGFMPGHLNAIALSSGPGSYTGLRVGSATAKGMCFALDIPLLAISTLQSMAAGIRGQVTEEYIIPMIDARRQEVYYSIFDKELNELKGTQSLILEKDLFQEMAQNKKLVICGNGAKKASEIIDNQSIRFVFSSCSAKYMGKLAFQKYEKGYFEDLAYFTPFYLKPPNITKSKKNLLKKK